MRVDSPVKATFVVQTGKARKVSVAGSQGSGASLGELGGVLGVIAGPPPNRRRVAVGATPDAGEQVTRKAGPAESCSAAAEVTGLFRAHQKW